MFVERDKQGGGIVGSYVHRQPGYAEELLSDDNPELVAFMAMMREEMERAMGRGDRGTKSERVNRLLAREGLTLEDLKAELAKPAQGGGAGGRP
jgi:hypothetical protein